MSSPFAPVIFPAPPRPDSPNYTNELNRWLTNLTLNLGGIGYLRGGGMWLSPDSLPISGYGLKPGEVFANDGILTWVREDDIWAGGFEITSGLGSLTVSS